MTALPLRRPAVIVFFSLPWALLGCASGARTPGVSGELVLERAVNSDGVPVLRNISGSKWNAPARLVEEVTIGGPEETEEEYLFGFVTDVWSTEDRTYVLDSSVPIVRVYDEAGVYLHDVGGQGEGPGEYQQPNGMVLLDDDRVLVSDAPVHRVQVFDPDGTHEGIWSYTGSGYGMTARSVIPAPGSAVWVFTVGGMEGGEVGAVYALIGPDGKQKTNPMPEIPNHEPVGLTVTGPQGERTFDWVVPFAPQRIRGIYRNGSWVVGDGASYRFWMLAPDGSPEKVIERYWEPVPVQEEEAAAHLRQAEATVRGMVDNPSWKWSGPELPATKPAFTALTPHADGRIWVDRPGPGEPIEGCVLEDVVGSRNEPPCWQDRRTWDVFDAEGEYLGEVPVPSDLSPFALALAHIEGERVTVVRPDAMGNPQVVRYRLVIGEEQE